MVERESTSSASPSSACRMPATTLAASSASNRSAGVPSRQGEQRPHRLLANAAQSRGIGHPAFWRACLLRRSQLGRNAPQDGFDTLLIQVVLRTAQMCRDPAPAIERSEQPMDGGLKCRRVVAHLAGFSDRLVDQRVERDHPPHQFAPLGLRIRELRPSQCQHAGEAARNSRP